MAGHKPRPSQDTCISAQAKRTYLCKATLDGINLTWWRANTARFPLAAWLCIVHFVMLYKDGEPVRKRKVYTIERFSSFFLNRETAWKICRTEVESFWVKLCPQLTPLGCTFWTMGALLEEVNYGIPSHTLGNIHLSFGLFLSIVFRVIDRLPERQGIYCKINQKTQVIRLIWGKYENIDEMLAHVTVGVYETFTGHKPGVQCQDPISTSCLSLKCGLTFLCLAERSRIPVTTCTCDMVF